MKKRYSQIARFPRIARRSRTIGPGPPPCRRRDGDERRNAKNERGRVFLRRTTSFPPLREKAVFDLYVCDLRNREETCFAPRPASFPAFSRNEGEGTIFAKRNACEEEENEGPRVSPCYPDSNARRTENRREQKRAKTGFVANQLSTEHEAPKGAPSENNGSVNVPCFPYKSDAQGPPQSDSSVSLPTFSAASVGDFFIFLEGWSATGQKHNFS